MATMALSRVVSEIFDVGKYRDLEIPSVKVVECGTIRLTAYGFLLVFYSLFVHKT